MFHDEVESRIESLFDAAVSLSATERKTYLDDACANEPLNVRAAVERLLRADRQLREDPSYLRTGCLEVDLAAGYADELDQSVSRTSVSADVRRLDGICRRFEMQWQRRIWPQIEDFLAECGEAERSALFRCLMFIEIDHRRSAGQPLTIDEYKERFPRYIRIVDDVFPAATSLDTDHASESGASTPIDSSGQCGLTHAYDAASARRSKTEATESNAHGQFGNYEILGEIARGGMGIVYRARQIDLDRVVALKTILTGQHAGAEEIKRFYVEAKAAAQLSHPNIVEIHEIGEVGGRHYICMEYVDGKSLAELTRNGLLPAATVAKHVSDVARATHFAHSRGILHRDLKPSNVLIDGSASVRITDFGLAKRIESVRELTATGQILGTPSYMAPEQAYGKELAPTTDIYALGALLYSLLTGRPPFQADNQLDTLIQVREEEPIPPRRLNSAVPRDLETICMKCLQKRPAQRYESAQHVAEDVERWLAGKPILARPIGPHARLAKWVRRKPYVATALCLFVVACITFATYWLTRPAYWDIRVTPDDASVTFDGNPVHLENGQNRVRTSQGRHRFTVSRAGYETVEQPVVLIRGLNNATVSNVELESVYGFAYADSEPQDAQIELRNESGELVAYGRTPFHSSELLTGGYVAKYSKDGYHTVERGFTMPNGSRTNRLPSEELEVAIEGAASYERLSDLRKKLYKQIDKRRFEFIETPLSDVLDELGSAWGFRIEWDPNARFRHINAQTPITSSFEDVSLYSALKLVLTPLGLWYHPSIEGRDNRGDDVIRVTTNERMYNQLLKVLHPVGDLTIGPWGMDGDRLAVQIRYLVAPSGWSDTGGPGQISYEKEIGCLLVMQHWSAQLSIDAHLSELRSARTANVELVERLERERKDQPPATELDQSRPGRQTTVQLQRIRHAIGGVDKRTTGSRVTLHRRPLEPLLRLPEFRSPVPLFGTLTMGLGEDTLISFAVEEDNHGNVRFFVDCNNDEDLTNDAADVTAQRIRGRNPHWLNDANILVSLGETTVTYPVRMTRNLDASPSVYVQSDMARKGTMVVDGQEYAIALIDSNCNGLFDALDHDIILIDIDQSGQFNSRNEGHSLAEQFCLGERINVGGTTIEISEISDEGMMLRFRSSVESVPQKRNFSVGSPAPAFAANDLDGASFSLSEAEGRIVLLYFWSSSWSPSLKYFAGEIGAIANDHPDDDLEVVGVPLNNSRDNIRRTAERLGLLHRQLVHTGHWTEHPAVQAFQIRHLPLIVLVDRSGKIVSRNTLSASTWPSIRGRIKKLLQN